MTSKGGSTKYPFTVRREQEGDHLFWVAQSDVLEGCVGQGESSAQAIRELAKNEDAWIEAATAHDIPVPETQPTAPKPKTWEAYKEHVKHADPNGDRDIASIEAAARSIAALQDAQEAFAGVAEESGLQSEEDIIRMVSDIRKER